MFNVKHEVIITQRPNATYPKRGKVIRMEFLESFEITSTWDQLTDNGTLTLPSNVYYYDEYNQLRALSGFNVNIGGLNKEPLFMRGDAIELKSGYRYADYALNRRVTEMHTIINGYISKVSSTIPIRLNIEDSMWLLKQTPMENRTYSNADTLESILKNIVDTVNASQNTKLTFRALTTTNFGQFVVENETASQLLNRLNTIYNFKFYFKGTELRGGALVYYQDDAVTHNFVMNGIEGNVLASGQELEYQRRDDIVLSAIAHNTVTKKMGGQTKDGNDKTAKVRIEVLCTIKNGVKTTKVINPGDRVPEATEGERRTYFYPSATTTDELATLAFEELERYFYNGLKGSFMAFGIPHVKHGDNVRIKNPKQPEQDGLYRVRMVSYSGGNGNRQRIELHYKLAQND